MQELRLGLRGCASTLSSTAASSHLSINQPYGHQSSCPVLLLAYCTADVSTSLEMLQLCIETDIHITTDGHLPMLHDDGLGRTTDVGEHLGQPAYNPFTGNGLSPLVKENNYRGFIEQLHLRDEEGRVRVELVPTLSDLVEDIRNNEANVVLQLDFKDKEAVEPAYWQLKSMQNAAGVPANEWCIYKLPASWWRTPAEFEALAWVQDAFRSGIQLAYIPVYLPPDIGKWDVMSSIQEYMRTNYTISTEIELYSNDGPLQEQLDYVKTASPGTTISRTAGIFFSGGDIIEAVGPEQTRFDRSSFPYTNRINNTVFEYAEHSDPVTADSLATHASVDGHDYRSDFAWILKTGFNWIITDTADLWHQRLRDQGLRNVSHFMADRENVIDTDGYYRP